MPKRGSANHKAKEPDWVVDAARELAELDGWTCKQIADKLEVPYFTVVDWVAYRTRDPNAEGRPYRYRDRPRRTRSSPA